MKFFLSKITATLQVAGSVEHKMNTKEYWKREALNHCMFEMLWNVKLLPSAMHLCTVWCQWNCPEKTANVYECSFTSCLKENKPVSPFHRAVKQVHIPRVLWTSELQSHPSREGLMGAIRFSSTSAAFFFLRSLSQRRYSESSFYELYFSAMTMAAGCLKKQTAMTHPKNVISWLHSSSSEN